MVAKYLIAGTLSAILAGGAVWVAADATEGDHPLPKETVKTVVTETITTETVETVTEAEGATSESIEGDVEAGTNSAQIIDRLMLRSSGSESGESESGESEAAIDAADHDSDSDADSLDISAAETSHTMEIGERTPEADTESRSAIEIDVKEVSPKDSVQTVVVNGSDKGTSTFVIAPKPDAPEKDGITVSKEVLNDDEESDPLMNVGPEESASVPQEIATPTPSPVLPDMSIGSKTSETFEIVMDQARQIEMIEARDDAFFRIFDYTLAKQDYDRSRLVIPQLSTEALRDTARQNLGIAMAEEGQLEAAFAIVEDMEIEALTDTARALIIRAATEMDG